MCYDCPDRYHCLYDGESSDSADETHWLKLSSFYISRMNTFSMTRLARDVEVPILLSNN